MIELMITVVILGILAAIALPSYQSSVSKSRRADAQGVLTSFANAMERHFTENSTYKGAGASGGDTGSPTIFATQAPLENSTKYYNLTIVSADDNKFTLEADPIGAQDGDGALRLTSTGARSWDKDDDGSFAHNW